MNVTNATTLRMFQNAAAQAHEQYANSIAMRRNFDYIAAQDTRYKPAAKSAHEAMRIAKISMDAAEYHFQCYLAAYEAEQPF